MTYTYDGSERCPECNCLLDDHQVPDDIEQHILMQYELRGEGPVTCGDCADCRFNPMDFDPVQAMQDAIFAAGDIIMDQRRDDAVTEKFYNDRV